MFTTFLRSLASLSWVIGPPISYGIALGGSFDLLFMVTMGSFRRSLASLSWVIGPPISYGIALGGSFDLLFMVTMGSFSLCCLACFFFLPNVLDKSIADKSRHIAWWKNGSVMMLFVGIACMFTAFSSYITSCRST